MVKFSALSDCPLISVIVPSFNQGRFIRQTLDSILKQDYRPIEVVVVDGASTDHTVEVLHEYDGVSEVKWISEPDSGVVEAVNKGFARAQGEVAAVQSSDDFYLPGAIRQGVEELRSDRSLGFTSGDIVKIDAEGRTLSQTRLKEFSIENILAAITWIPQPSTFFRLDLAKSLGGWREEVPYAADTDLWMRMMLKAPAKKIDALFAKRRMHDVQRDKQGALIIKDYTRVIEDLFEKYGAPANLRPAAEAGILLQMNRYMYGEGRRIKVKRLREATVLYPPLSQHIKVSGRVAGIDRARAVAMRVISGLKR